MVIAILGCVLVGCNKNKNEGNLREIAKDFTNSVISDLKSQGGDCFITDTLICNDSVIILSYTHVANNGFLIPAEDIFVRQRIDTGFVYRFNSRIPATRSIAEEIEVNYISCNMTSLKMFLSNDKYNVFVNKLLYTKALAECIKNGVVLKDIKK